MRVNGEDLVLENPVTLQKFLEQEGYEIARVAVEKNGEIILKSAFTTEMLKDNDKLEIVSFIGGG